MTKIKNIDDFKNITSMITSFSHAYLLNVNSISKAYPYIKEFAKLIIKGNDYNEESEIYKDISYKIDNDEFDDLYIVNPDTIGINTIEVTKLLQYMQTKSIRENGRRVYIICGIERMSRDVSNKILKFLEEPEYNIYALLISENYEKVLPTIISRCQLINLSFENDEFDSEIIDKSKMFFKELIDKKKKTIAYEYNIFKNDLSERIKMYDYFTVFEKILSANISNKYNHEVEDIYLCEFFNNIEINQLINILKLTSELKPLIKKNINLNLLIDRYIIEITEVLSICKK